LTSARTGPIISNCSFAGNWALEYGGAIYCGRSGWIDLDQSILWSNRADLGDELAVAEGQDARLRISYCDVAGGMTGVYAGAAPLQGVLDWKDTNIEVDPCFVDAGYWETQGTPNDVNDDMWAEGDYHLLSEVGRFDPEAGAWVQDALSSPCIDAGKSRKVDGSELWPHGQRNNLGAYGSTQEASLSPSNIGVGDFNGDGLVRYEDLSDFLGDWLHGFAFSRSDLNHDLEVDLKDLAVLLAHWRLDPLPAEVPPQRDSDPLTWASDPNLVSMTWAQEPNLIHACGSSASMVADTFYTTDGTGVEYFFQDFDNSYRHSDGWLRFLVGQPPRWSVSGLEPGEGGQPREYRFVVQARNIGNGLETEWSNWAGVYPISSSLTPAFAEWETEPNLVVGTVTMKAREVTDSCGLAVEYFFTCSDPNLSSPAWQASPDYSVDVTDAARTFYAFSVQARNSEEETNEPSSPLVWVDLSCKLSPSATAWEIPPHGTASGQSGTISMKAQEVTDSCGQMVTYRFTCAEAPHLSSQAWQESREYSVNVPVGEYSFSVQAMNAEGLTADPSPFVTADLIPPTPNPPKWAWGGTPVPVNVDGGNFGFWYQMTASAVVDNVPDSQVQYFFRCSYDNDFNSPWQSSPYYTVKIGRYQEWVWYVKARDQHGNETAWSRVPYEQQ